MALDLDLQPWHAGIDPATIPDAVLASERGRRNAAKRKRYSGGDVWGKHNPNVKGCRCAACIAKRDKKLAKQLAKRRAPV